MFPLTSPWHDNGKRPRFEIPVWWSTNICCNSCFVVINCFPLSEKIMGLFNFGIQYFCIVRSPLHLWSRVQPLVPIWFVPIHRAVQLSDLACRWSEIAPRQELDGNYCLWTCQTYKRSAPGRPYIAKKPYFVCKSPCWWKAVSDSRSPLAEKACFIVNGRLEVSTEYCRPTDPGVGKSIRLVRELSKWTSTVQKPNTIIGWLLADGGVMCHTFYFVCGLISCFWLASSSPNFAAHPRHDNFWFSYRSCIELHAVRERNLSALQRN